MNGQNSWFLGNLVRVPVFMDIGALITVVWIGMVVGGDLRSKILAIVAFIATVVLHELGHALTARARGMQGIHIVISALGGYCSYQGLPRPSAGLMISLAGPAMNFLLVALLWGVFAVIATVHLGVQPGFSETWNCMAMAMNRGLPELGEFAGLLCELAAYGLWINIFLGVLNIMPVFPMDGGQAVYRFLQMTTTEQKARSGTLAVSIGGAIACIGLFSYMTGGLDTFIIILMLFLLYQAWQTLG